MSYVLQHGVKEGLIGSADEWPGLTCIPELVHGQRRLFPWYDQTARYLASRKAGHELPASNFMTLYPLELTPLPLWEDLSASERHREARELLAVSNQRAVELREGKPALGLEMVLRQDPHESPQEVKRSPRPLCHASTKEGRQAYRRTYDAFVAAYRVASKRFREGDLVELPPFAFRPRLPFLWRSAAPPRAPPTASRPAA